MQWTWHSLGKDLGNVPRPDPRAEQLSKLLGAADRSSVSTTGLRCETVLLADLLLDQWIDLWAPCSRPITWPTILNLLLKENSQ